MGILLLIVSAGCTSHTQNTAPQIAIVPAPASLEKQEGYFEFSAKTRCSVENEMQQQVGTQFFRLFETVAGFKSEIEQNYPQAYMVMATDSSLGEEAYRLQVTSEQIRIEANSQSGFFYALQSLRLLLPPAIAGKNKSAGRMDNSGRRNKGCAPVCLSRIDAGCVALLYSEKTVLRIIENMSVLKMNKLHLHLVDDNGWRFLHPE